MADESTTTQGDTIAVSETPAETQAPVEEASTTTEVVDNAEATTSTEEEAPVSEETTDKVDGNILKRDTEDSSVPESYEWNLPEGTELSEEELGQLNQIAKDSELSATEAPKAFEFAKNMHEAVMKDVEKTQAEELQAMKDSTRAEWEKQPDADTKTLHVEKFLKKHGMLDHFIDNHYEADIKLMSAMAAAGALISEASHITGTETAPNNDVLYPNSPELY